MKDKIKGLGVSPSVLFTRPVPFHGGRDHSPRRRVFCYASCKGEIRMDKIEREVLQAAKEIAVKFIETQRISPANFEQIFPLVYGTVLKTVLEGQRQHGQEAGQE